MAHKLNYKSPIDSSVKPLDGTDVSVAVNMLAEKVGQMSKVNKTNTGAYQTASATLKACSEAINRCLQPSQAEANKVVSGTAPQLR